MSDPRVQALLDLVADGGVAETPPVRGGALIRRAPAWAPGAVRAAGTRASRPLSARRLRELRARRPLRLNLGCGWIPKDGYVNVDLFATRADLVWDLAWGVPFDDASAEAIVHEHLMEHLTLAQGLQLARECLRVLQPGGVLRVGVPDAGLCIASYRGQADPGWAQSAPTGMLAVNRLFYEHGHRAMYDGETLALVLEAAGFAEAAQRDFGDSRIAPHPDEVVRRDGTLYVEAVRPA